MDEDDLFLRRSVFVDDFYKSGELDIE